MVLIHQPFGDYYGTYRAMEELYRMGRVKAIGVSNFSPDRLVDLAINADIPPMVDQVETHVFNQQTEARKWMDKYGCRIESWGPFAEGKNNLFSNPVLTDIGGKYGKTAAQVAQIPPAERHRGHTQKRPCGKDEGEHRRLRFQALRGGHGRDREVGYRHLPLRRPLRSGDVGDVQQVGDLKPPGGIPPASHHHPTAFRRCSELLKYGMSNS